MVKNRQFPGVLDNIVASISKWNSLINRNPSSNWSTQAFGETQDKISYLPRKNWDRHSTVQNYSPIVFCTLYITLWLEKESFQHWQVNNGTTKGHVLLVTQKGQEKKIKYQKQQFMSWVLDNPKKTKHLQNRYQEYRRQMIKQFLRLSQFPVRPLIISSPEK